MGSVKLLRQTCRLHLMRNNPLFIFLIENILNLVLILHSGMFPKLQFIKLKNAQKNGNDLHIFRDITPRPSYINGILIHLHGQVLKQPCRAEEDDYFDDETLLIESSESTIHRRKDSSGLLRPETRQNVGQDKMSDKLYVSGENENYHLPRIGTGMSLEIRRRLFTSKRNSAENVRESVEWHERTRTQVKNPRRRRKSIRSLGGGSARCQWGSADPGPDAPDFVGGGERG